MLNNKELVAKICNRITDYVMENKLSNDDLLQIIEHTGSFLNLMTRADYSKRTGISYNGAKHHRRNVKLFGCTLIVDNQ
jgi:hypothetical protein